MNDSQNLHTVTQRYLQDENSAGLVDTNILVRAVQRNHPLVRAARRALRSLVEEGDELCVTWQNIAEFWKSAPGLRTRTGSETLFRPRIA